jgi:alpha-amylase/alpha-mannosidase (GH57 family)
MSKRPKYICIHGHFYQPPRENAWLETVEVQDSAAPFHDWNERINFECYAPNAAARILDRAQNIVDIVNNYSRISFNFGPTLLSWMEKAQPEAYRLILEADRIGQERFGGHGPALAQVHSHLILPLANARDKETQVKWGIHDFEHRFGRKPEGIWLAETAADTDTLEVLADNGIKFTILAPRQGKAIRKIGDKDWQELAPDSIDTRRPYLCRLPSGRSIALFFYHGGIAQGVAFEGLLNNGRHFAERFAEAFSEDDEPQLAHIATDGESYGHHHRYGEMALAACLHHIEEHDWAQITNYGQYLELFPPEYEAQIHENSSWSCVHGVERWRSDCGCNSGGRHGWNQAWRKPLREALDWLRDELVPIYERLAGKYLKDPWAARNDYVAVLLDRAEENVGAFVASHARQPLAEEEIIRLLRLMEMQRHAMLMYTSCGWFFDEISGIETNQILQYANRAIHYALQVADVDLHGGFIRRLEQAPSNVYENGAASYKEHVLPARVDLGRVGIHYAISSLFESYPERLEFFNYVAQSEDFDLLPAGVQRLAVGRTTVQSKTTRSKKQFSFAVLHLGHEDLIGNVSTDMSIEEFEEMKDKLKQAFKESSLAELIGLMQEHFGREKYALSDLFRDERQKILALVTNQSLEKAERALKNIYQDNYKLMDGMARSGVPVPAFYRSAAEFVVNRELLRIFENGSLNIRKLRQLYAEFSHWSLRLADRPAFQLAVSERLYREILTFQEEAPSAEQLDVLVAILELLEKLDIHLDFWRSQNVYFSILQAHRTGDYMFGEKSVEEAFLRLGRLLKVKV